MADVAGIILCGGLSSRMGGGDKTLLRLGSKPLISYVIDRLDPQSRLLAINANGDPSRFASFGFPVVGDEFDGNLGPLAGVLAGLEFASASGASHIVTAAGDTPFFPRDLTVRLVTAACEVGEPIALAATQDRTGSLERHPTFGLWPVALKDDLRRALHSGIRKVVRWTDLHGAASAIFGSRPFNPFFNINTPEDMEKAMEILEEWRP